MQDEERKKFIIDQYFYFQHYSAKAKWLTDSSLFYLSLAYPALIISRVQKNSRKRPKDALNKAGLSNIPEKPRRYLKENSAPKSNMIQLSSSVGS